MNFDAVLKKPLPGAPHKTGPTNLDLGKSFIRPQLFLVKDCELINYVRLNSQMQAQWYGEWLAKGREL